MSASALIPLGGFLNSFLSVTTDSLIFEPKALEPDEDLRLQFKAVNSMPPEE